MAHVHSSDAVLAASALNDTNSNNIGSNSTSGILHVAPAAPYVDNTAYSSSDARVQIKPGEPVAAVVAGVSSDDDAASGKHAHGGGAVGFVKHAVHTVVPPGGFVSNMFNFAANTLGISIVSMPSAFNSSGVCLSSILMVVCGVLIVYSFYLLGITCERTHARSWEHAARILLFRGMDYVVSVLMMIIQFGGMIGCVIVVHSLIKPFLDSDSVAPYLKTTNGHRLLTATVWLFGMQMLALPRHVASLRYFSVVGVTFILLFAIAIITTSAKNHLPHLHDMRLFSTGLDAVNGLTIFIFAFTGHGLTFKMYNEMRTKSARGLATAAAGSVSLVGTLYYLVGFFGYADLGLVVSGSVFQYYDIHQNVFLMVVYIGVLLKMFVGYAINSQACRLPVYYIMHKNINTMPFWQHACVTLFLGVVAFVLGILIPDINIVFNLLGSICGGALAFLLPAYFVMYTGGWTVAKVGWFHVGMTYLLIVAGVVSIVFGTIVTIYTTVQTYS